MAWQRGPLPPDTYGWGGVVPIDHRGSGFFFADFRGDHVAIVTRDNKVIQADEVAWYDNSLTLPPHQDTGRRLP